MRLFIGIEVPDEVKKQVTKQLNVFQNKHKDFNWTIPENYHITVHFLGEVAPEYLNPLKKKIEESLFELPTFHLFSGECDLFMRHNITIYMGFSREKKLEHVVERINTVFASHSEQKYLPHLTLAKYRIPSKQQYLALKKEVEHLELEVDFPVDSIYLYESKLGGRNPVYEKIHEFKLG
jgi:2'-5' RNA ligase